MRVGGVYRTVRHKDHVVPEPLPRPLTGREAALDIRVWTRTQGTEPLLLVTSPRKCGPAVARNRFRRQVRMAFLEALRRQPLAPTTVVWVRPSRGRAADSLDFPALTALLDAALARAPRPDPA